MRQYKKKPVIIRAEQWFRNGDVPEAQIQMLDTDFWVCGVCGQAADKHGNCKTLEGYHIVCPGDYIICGIKGEFYPCKEGIFKLTYDEVMCEQVITMDYEKAYYKALEDIQKLTTESQKLRGALINVALKL